MSMSRGRAEGLNWGGGGGGVQTGSFPGRPRAPSGLWRSVLSANPSGEHLPLPPRGRSKADAAPAHFPTRHVKQKEPRRASLLPSRVTKHTEDSDGPKYRPGYSFDRPCAPDPKWQGCPGSKDSPASDTLILRPCRTPSSAWKQLSPGGSCHPRVIKRKHAQRGQESCSKWAVKPREDRRLWHPKALARTQFQNRIRNQSHRTHWTTPELH